MPKKEREPRAPPPGVQWWCYHSDCECSFPTRDALLKHNISVHGHLKFSCDICDNKFKSKGDLAAHQRWEPASVFAQLSLKEGLTVFRDPEFSSDVGSSTVKRIADVLKHRIYQYPQDAGPMAHPVRPHSYIKMDNFYTVMVYEKKEEEFVFNDISERPIPSLLRGFSTPVRLHTDLSDSDLFFLAHDSDEFNHWEAGQILARKLMLSLVGDFQENKPLVLNPKFVQGFRSILCDSSLDKEFISKAITLPGEGEIMDMMEVADPDAVHAVRNFIRMELASALKEEFLNTVKNNHSSELYEFNHPRMARHALKNIALAYLGSLEDPEVSELALNEYRLATNMTEQFAAFVAIEQKPGEIRDQVLPGFYNKGQHDFLAKKICDKYRVIWILNGMSM